jgi:hypothetical protein
MLKNKKKRIIMLKNIGLLLLGFSLLSTTAFADCDISQYRWDCEIPVAAKAKPGKSKLFYCGDNYGYITKRQYEILSRYRIAEINMVLKIDGEFVDDPCYPSDI